MRWSLLTLLLKAIEQNNDFAFVKYKEHPKDVASIFDTQLIQTIPYEFNKLLGSLSWVLSKRSPYWIFSCSFSFKVFMNASK